MDDRTKKTLLDILVDNHRSNPILFSFLSAILASIGLATDSYSTIIGSMLLSPIGNLITVKNVSDLLREASVPLKSKYQNWIISIVVVVGIIVGVGYVVGKIFQAIRNPFTNKPVDENWPTNEMKSRADPMNVIYLIFIALTCAIALPLSTLMNSSVRLVAIGIATALVPPLANIGLSLSMRYKTPKQQEYVNSAVKTGSLIFLVNFLILWLPSKYLLRIFIQKDNYFKTIENFLNFRQ